MTLPARNFRSGAIGVPADRSATPAAPKRSSEPRRARRKARVGIRVGHHLVGQGLQSRVTAAAGRLSVTGLARSGHAGRQQESESKPHA
ncbi:hypothetical protein SANTM175S_03465 [Streptomyces antimycoticus]